MIRTIRGHLNKTQQTGNGFGAIRGEGYDSINVGEYERWGSVLGGGILALYGLKRGSLGGLTLAALGSAFVYRGITGHCGCYAALGINTAARPRGEKASVAAGHGVRVDQSIRINRPADELFQFWRKVENLPRVMTHLQCVTDLDGRRSRWMASAPLGINIVWEAEVHTERNNELISWRSVPGSDIDTAGSVHFNALPDGQSTELRIELKYNPPGEKLGDALAKLFGESPEDQIRDDLVRFKFRMEAEKSQGNGSEGLTQPSASDQPSQIIKQDIVEEASQESFPASDAPAWTARPNT